MINESRNGSLYAVNVMGPDGYISRTQGGTTSYYMKNAHGDIVRAVTESAGKTFSATYNAWGEVMDSDNGNGYPIGYAGEFHDKESGMIYLRGRYYDPEIRRFITEDPAKDGWNWYAYCGNNPVMFVDSWGFSYDEVINALDSIYNAKNTMNHTTPGSASYNNALETAKANKAIIRNSDVYIENWGELTPVLSPLFESSSNSLESIAGMKTAVQNAKDAYVQSSYTDSMIFIVTTAAVMVTAIKGGRALLGLATSSASVLPLTTAVDPNKLNHIFGKAQHGLSEFLSLYGGDQTKAYNAIRNAAQIVVNNSGVSNAIYKSTENPIIVNINGFIMHIGGRVIDGVFNLGTVFIK